MRKSGLTHPRNDIKSKNSKGKELESDFYSNCTTCFSRFLTDFIIVASGNAQPCLTLCNPMDCNPPGPKLLCPRNFLGKNTGVDCHFLLQGIFLTQESISPALAKGFFTTAPPVAAKYLSVWPRQVLAEACGT